MTYAQNLWLYFVLLFGIIIVPGMDMFFVIANSLTGGRRAGLASVLGINLGGIWHTVFGAFFVGAITALAPQFITVILLAYYLKLDIPLGLAMTIVFAALLYLAELIAALPMKEGVSWFLVLFAGGWVIQLIGHIYEGRKPALLDNLFQIFVAPIFLCAEVFFALGYRPALHAAVQKRALQMRADAGIGHPTAA